ncbi:MAG TPA: hydrogenase iron-sulfur subunit [Thermoproteota archaeon]|nr:hydrogenase iron-sulfur subunit [Thermoproteota archaeon]
MSDPKIVAFMCWCSGSGADQAGVEKISYPAGVTPVRIPCSALLGPELVLKAFEKGADGVIVSACKPSDMRRVAPSRLTAARLEILRSLLREVGIEGERLQMAWISSQEGAKFAEQVSEAARTIAALGPSKLKEMMKPV